MSAPAARVEAYLAVKGRDAPREIEGDAVVYRDSAFTEVARAAQRLAAACLSDSVGLLQFNFDLPPGSYVVGLSARDSSRDAIGSWRRARHGHRGACRDGSRSRISSSRAASTPAGARRRSPRPTTPCTRTRSPQAPRDQPFGFYFEVYNLVSDDKGAGQVSIEYQIQSTRKDKRPFFIKAVNPRKNDPVVNVAKVDEVAGTRALPVREREPGAAAAGTVPHPGHRDRPGEQRLGDEVARFRADQLVPVADRPRALPSSASWSTPFDPATSNPLAASARPRSP
jgi:hypothetical protein